MSPCIGTYTCRVGWYTHAQSGLSQIWKYVHGASFRFVFMWNIQRWHFGHCVKALNSMQRILDATADVVKRHKLRDDAFHIVCTEAQNFGVGIPETLYDESGRWVVVVDPPE